MSQLKWLLEYHFLRGDFIFCQKIMQDMLQEDQNLQEYTSYIQGKIYCAEGRQQQGLELFQSSYKLNPNSSQNLHQIAKCLISQGRYEKAIEALWHAGKQAERSPQWNIFYDTALCHYKLKQFTPAEQNCKEAAKLGRQKCIYKLLSLSLIKLNKIDEALEVFRLALRLFPKSSSLYTGLGTLFVRISFNEDAFRTLNTALKLKPTNWMAAYHLAVLHQKRGSEGYDEAINLYKNILQSKSNTLVDVYNNLGLCYFGKNKFVLALTCLLKSRELNPMSIESLFNLGLVYASLNQYCSAIIYWRAASRFREDPRIDFLVQACLTKLELV